MYILTKGGLINTDCIADLSVSSVIMHGYGINGYEIRAYRSNCANADRDSDYFIVSSYKEEWFAYEDFYKICKLLISSILVMISFVLIV